MGRKGHFRRRKSTCKTLAELVVEMLQDAGRSRDPGGGSGGEQTMPGLQTQPWSWPWRGSIALHAVEKVDVNGLPRLSVLRREREAGGRWVRSLGKKGGHRCK